MQNVFISQNYDMYNEEDHHTWSVLCKRQNKLHESTVCKEYLQGFRDLKLDITRIVNIDDTSALLQSITGWTLVPVTGLIPTGDFFHQLINKTYPITISIRKPHEIDFSEQPDIFHDVCGHLPLLTNPDFVKFLTSYSIIAFKYVDNEKAIEMLGRLYWYTYEMGVIRENGAYKAYGGAIITSASESANLNDPAIPKHEFDIDHIFKTPYNPYKLQNEYFVINSFDELFSSLENLEAKLIDHLLAAEVEETKLEEAVTV